MTPLRSKEPMEKTEKFPTLKKTHCVSVVVVAPLPIRFPTNVPREVGRVVRVERIYAVRNRPNYAVS